MGTESSSASNNNGDQTSANHGSSSPTSNGASSAADEKAAAIARLNILGGKYGASSGGYIPLTFAKKELNLQEVGEGNINQDGNYDASSTLDVAYRSYPAHSVAGCFTKQTSVPASSTPSTIDRGYVAFGDASGDKSIAWDGESDISETTLAEHSEATALPSDYNSFMALNNLVNAIYQSQTTFQAQNLASLLSQMSSNSNSLSLSGTAAENFNRALATRWGMYASQATDKAYAYDVQLLKLEMDSDTLTVLLGFAGSLKGTYNSADFELPVSGQLVVRFNGDGLILLVQRSYLDRENPGEEAGADKVMGTSTYTFNYA